MSDTVTAEALALRLLAGREYLDQAEAQRLLGELRAKWLRSASADVRARDVDYLGSYMAGWLGAADYLAELADAASARPAAAPAEPHNTCDHILRPVPDVPVVWCEKCGGSFPHLGGCARSGSDDCWARCCAPTRFPAPAEPHAAVEVVPVRWGGEEAWIDEDGSVGVQLTLPGGQPAYLTLDGDAPRLLAEELICAADAHTTEEN